MAPLTCLSAKIIIRTNKITNTSRIIGRQERREVVVDSRFDVVVLRFRTEPEWNDRGGLTWAMYGCASTSVEGGGCLG